MSWMYWSKVNVVRRAEAHETEKVDDRIAAMAAEKE